MFDYVTFFNLFNGSISVPSQAPIRFLVNATTSTSIRASWQLLPADSRNGIIRGYKLFYKKKGSAGSPTRLIIHDEATLAKNVTGLDKFTEYEFQVLAFTSVGDGPRSSVKVERTKEDHGKEDVINYSKPVHRAIFLTSENCPQIHKR